VGCRELVRRPLGRCLLGKCVWHTNSPETRLPNT
jgi:hypothetical protein